MEHRIHEFLHRDTQTHSSYGSKKHKCMCGDWQNFNAWVYFMAFGTSYSLPKLLSISFLTSDGSNKV